MRNGSELFGRQAASAEDIGKSGQEARGMVDGLVQVAQVKGGEEGGMVDGLVQVAQVTGGRGGGQIGRGWHRSQVRGRGGRVEAAQVRMERAAIRVTHFLLQAGRQACAPAPLPSLLSGPPAH